MRKGIAVVLLAAIAAVALTLLAACGGGSDSGGGDGSAKEPIKIGAVSPFTGDYSIYGQTLYEGAQMAADDINAKGGLLGGRKVEIVKLDDKGDTKEGASIAQQVVASGEYTAVIGPIFSSVAKAVAPIFERGQVPLMVVYGSTPGIPALGDYIWRININDAVVGAEMADYTYNTLGYKRIAVIMDQTDYTQGVYDAFSSKMKELGGEVVSTLKYVGQQDKDFSMVLTAAEKQDPDCLFLDSFHTEAALILQQKASLGIETPVIIPDASATPQLIELAGDTAEGAIVFAYFDRAIPDPTVQDFVKKYDAKYPNGSMLASVPFAYDAINALAEAIRISGSADRVKVNEGLSQVKDLPGVTGHINFDKDGDRPVGWNVVLKVEGGEFKVVELTTES